ncbi:MAG TPA: threonine synthase [Anaerolineales bacterium]|jgi:threonine synthase|nr:threonine synthase [Anaerolineales bacterium]
MKTPNHASALAHLVCPQCNRQFDADRLQTYCHDCQSPLQATYDLESLRHTLDPSEVKTRPRGLWRWSELLPVRDPAHRLTLGEGDTPLLPVPRLSKILGLTHLFVKDESTNPTGTFKARGLAVAVARATELGVKAFVIPTAGNAGGALASYAARAHCEAHVFMPQDAPRVNVAEVRAAGADLVLVDGLINDAGRAAAEAAKNSQYPWFDVSTFKEPYRLEGKKTMGLELAESFQWQLPDIIVYPTGGGTGLVGMWKAFAELEKLGWIGPRRPRMVSVQAEGCAPIVRAFESGAQRAKPWEGAHTLAAGLRVPVAFADQMILRALYESQGMALAVSDGEIIASQQQLARIEGIFAAPEGAATLAALNRLIQMGWIGPEEVVVLFNTGTGLKYVV